MYLEKLEINGFKSFAKPSSFDFLPNTITAIVGPNGSGKSNIIDAIKWVLGEQSSKSIRSQQSQDILFSSPKVKSSNYAEVALRLNNESKRFPLDYNNIEINRRFYRQGEGEYRLNKNPIKVSDLNYLLSQAKIGQKSFSIISQGSIHQLLNFNKEDLQNFFADATGVRAPQMQLENSQKQLQKNTEQAQYLNNLINEMLPRLQWMEKDVKRFQQRQAVEEKLHHYQRQAVLRKYVDWQSAYEKIQADLGFYINKVTELKSSANTEQEKLDELTAILSNQQFLQLNQEYQKLLGEKQDLYSKLNDQNISLIPDLDEKLFSTEKGLREAKADLSEQEKLLSQYKDINLQEYIPGEVEKYIEKQQQEKKEILGFIKNLFQCEEKYLLPIEAVLGATLNGLAVSDDDVAVEIIKNIKEKRLGTLHLYPLNKIQGRPDKKEIQEITQQYNGCRPILDYLKYDEQFNELFQFLLGNTVLSPEIDSAKEISQQYPVRIVTMQGEIFEASGIIKGGYKVFKFLSKEIVKKLHQAQQAVTQLKLQINKLEMEEKYYRNLQGKNQGHDNSTLREAILAINDKLKKMEGDAKEMNEQYLKAQQQFQEQQKICQHKQDDLMRAQHILDNLQEQARALEARKTDLAEVNPKELTNFDANLDEQKINQEIAKCEGKLLAIGEIDENIINEYNTLKERYENLNREQSDLVSSANNLEAINNELKKLIHSEFTDKIKLISGTFNDYFQTLFKGGKAALQGEISDNEIKVDIESYIPGKKIKHLNLFSGGEKTLISTALIMAIVHTQKTPFVVLDEIDAALDELNSQQLADILSDINKLTQIVLITHNKVIMQSAQILYGITMNPAGYSHVYSMQV
ncbi:MAG TPA: AAA family ATPase [bacterium]|nr:AAA family ATPase [bacterium]